MTFDASHALRFINRARAATGLPALTELPFTGAVRVDERACLLARALQAEVGGSVDPRFRDHFVVRLGDQALARAVASRTGQPCNDHAEVLLPEPLARLVVAFDRGQVERRDARYVAPGQLSFDDLETAACQAAAVVGDSSAGHSTKGEHRCSPSAGSCPAGFPGRLRDHSASPPRPRPGTGAQAAVTPAPQPTTAQKRRRYRVPNARGPCSPAPAAARTTAAAVTASPCPARRPAHTIAGTSPRVAACTSRPVVVRIARGHPPAAVVRASWARAGAHRAGALGRVHHHTISAAHGGRAGGQRTRAERTPPGPPVPHDSLHPNGMPPNQPLRLVPRHAALCFERRVPGRSADQTVERHPRQRTRCLACRLHSTLPARRCA